VLRSSPYRSGGGVGSDLGGKAGEVSLGKAREKVFAPGEKGGVGVALFGKTLERAESG